MLESGAERSALGASLRGARHSSSRRCLAESEDLNPRSRANEMTRTPPLDPIAQEACFGLHEILDMFYLEKYI